jgi:hypothetical protein
MTKTLLISAAVAVAAAPTVHSQMVVAAPGVEARQDQKNIFDAHKYAWEKAQWAEKLATLHNTLTTVRERLETANLVKQAIGDPVAAIALIDNGLFSDYLQDSGIADTLTELAGIAAEGVQLSATIQELFEPIDISGWRDLSSSFEGVASFRDPGDPLKRFRAVENAYSRFEVLLLQARSRRQTLKSQISRLNIQLKNAKDDAEVQKLAGSLQAAETALIDLDDMTDTAHQQMESLQVLNENRKEQEEVAADEISRERNRELARFAAGSGSRTAGLQRAQFRSPAGILKQCPRYPIFTQLPMRFERCSFRSRFCCVSWELERWAGGRVRTHALFSALSLRR